MAIFLKLLFAVVAAVAAASATMDYVCVPGTAPVGVTVPRGRIVLPVGSELQIFCHLNPNLDTNRDKNASDLSFYRNSEKIQPPLVTAVNETTIRLSIPNMPFSDAIYTCKVLVENTPRGVCTNQVRVAKPPEEVSNFSCVSENWENLKCSWKKPNNTIYTNYSLIYVRKLRRYTHKFKCGVSYDEMCIWHQKSEAQFPNHLDNLILEMNGTNDLEPKGRIWKYNLSIFSVVVPNEPEDLFCKRQSSRSVELSWKAPYPMDTFEPGLTHKVSYQSHWDEDRHWTEVDLVDTKSKLDYSLNIDLEYANTNYTFLVKSRSSAAPNTRWSRATSVTVHTFAAIPSAAPRTAMSSFETMGKLQDRNIVIFWQQILPTQENGDNFMYSVRVYKDELPLDVKPKVLTHTYAVFNDLSYESYRFVVSSVNEVGQSTESSEVVVPRKEEMIGVPLSFTKIDFSQGVYELSWKPPKKNHAYVTNYTVFWCMSKPERPYLCDGYLDWMTIPKDQLVVNVTVQQKEQYQFAVAANSERGSSGMVWSTCTAIYNRAVGKIQDLWINGTGSRDISIGWRLDCSDRVGIVEGYRVHYCPINFLSMNCSRKCTGPKMSANAYGADANGHVLIGLAPYTRYLITVSVITRVGEGTASDPVCNVTLPAAPSDPPSSVGVSNVTATSFVVSWLPPVVMNGALSDFVVGYNDHFIKVAPNTLGDGRYYTVLENLIGYTNYTVKIRACTVSCSHDSEPVMQRTLIGAPGIINMPEVKFLNTSMVSVIWGHPSYIGAPQLTRYDINLTAHDGNENKTRTHSIRGDKRLVFIKIPDCSKEDSVQTYTVRVRGVNEVPESHLSHSPSQSTNPGADGKIKELKGPWSAERERNCFVGDSRTTWLMIIGGVAAFVVTILIATGYLAGRMWRKCKEMRDVEVKLPPGLAPPDDLPGELKTSFMPEHRFDSTLLYNRLQSQCSDDDRERHMSGDTGCSMYAMDDELLLKGKEQGPGRNPSGDSSGCMSGHDSVSSSMTAGTHLSTDSGNEADQQQNNRRSSDSNNHDVFAPNPWDVAAVASTSSPATPRLRYRNPSRGDGEESSPDYARMGLGKSATDVASLASGGKVEVASSTSTPNLDRAGRDIVAPTAVAVAACQLHRGSTGYISMPSSQESMASYGYAKAGDDYVKVGANGGTNGGANGGTNGVPNGVPNGGPNGGANGVSGDAHYTKVGGADNVHYTKVGGTPPHPDEYLQVGAGYVALPPVSKPSTGYVALGTGGATVLPSVDNPPAAKPRHEVTSYCKVGIDDGDDSCDEAPDFPEVEFAPAPTTNGGYVSPHVSPKHGAHVSPKHVGYVPSPKHGGYVPSPWKGYTPHAAVVATARKGDSATVSPTSDEGHYCSAAVR